jgi:hypothetical protein
MLVELKRRLREISDLNVLNWDQATYMPKAISARCSIVWRIGGLPRGLQ